MHIGRYVEKIQRVAVRALIDGDNGTANLPTPTQQMQGGSTGRIDHTIEFIVRRDGAFRIAAKLLDQGNGEGLLQLALKGRQIAGVDDLQRDCVI